MRPREHLQGLRDEKKALVVNLLAVAQSRVRPPAEFRNLTSRHQFHLALWRGGDRYVIDETLQSKPQTRCGSGKRRCAAEDVRILPLREPHPEQRIAQKTAARLHEVHRGRAFDVLIRILESPRIDFMVLENLSRVATPTTDKVQEPAQVSSLECAVHRKHVESTIHAKHEGILDPHCFSPSLRHCATGLSAYRRKS